jgi:hypothetical protein
MRFAIQQVPTACDLYNRSPVQPYISFRAVGAFQTSFNQRQILHPDDLMGTTKHKASADDLLLSGPLFPRRYKIEMERSPPL